MSGEGTPERVAFDLCERIWAAEKGASANFFQEGDRQKFLELYAECLRTIQAPQRAMKQVPVSGT